MFPPPPSSPLLPPPFTNSSLHSRNTSPHSTPTSLNCDTSQNFNQGCGVSFTSSSTSASYGHAFNTARGGWYVMSKTASKGVQVWFWGRDDPRVPPEIKDKPKSDGKGKEVKPEAWWGTPAATFPPDDCDWKKHFDAHQIVFDLTFCVRSRSGSMPCSFWG